MNMSRIFVELRNKISVKCACREKGYLLSCDRTNVSFARRKATKADYAPADKQYSRSIDGQTGITPFGYFLLTVPISTFLLGTWQVQRRKWKVDLIEQMKKRTTEEPIELPQDLEELQSKEYFPVKVRGRFLHEKEFTVGPRSLIVNGVPAVESGLISGGKMHVGCYVITPFKLEDRDLTILVNRGWVPKKYKNRALRKEEQTQDVVELTGIVRLNEDRPPFVAANSPKDGAWFYRDLNAMAEMAGTAPVYIEQVASDKKQPGSPIAGQTRVTLRNEHLSYVFTWYTLSAITGWMWYRGFIQRLPII